MVHSLYGRKSMKTAKLIHNPTAGDEEHSRKKLISMIESGGFKCVYSSTKDDDWKTIAEGVDFLIGAGGDGTVRKIVRKLLNRKVLEKTWPIGVLPLGTANNIARALEIEGTSEEIVQSWKTGRVKQFDVGAVSLAQQTDFFLESFGCGIFPYLMMETKKRDLDSITDLEKKMNTALELLHEIVISYEPHHLELDIDGAHHSGKYILVEVMNTKSIGPNLVLAPGADPGDGFFNVVLIAEKNKDRFAAYLQSKFEGEEAEYRYDTLEGKDIRLTWQGTHIHVDGEIIKTKDSVEMEIQLKRGLVEFLIR